MCVCVFRLWGGNSWCPSIILWGICLQPIREKPYRLNSECSQRPEVTMQWPASVKYHVFPLIHCIQRKLSFKSRIDWRLHVDSMRQSTRHFSKLKSKFRAQKIKTSYWIFLSEQQKMGEWHMRGKVQCKKLITFFEYCRIELHLTVSFWLRTDVLRLFWMHKVILSVSFRQWAFNWLHCKLICSTIRHSQLNYSLQSPVFVITRLNICFQWLSAT